MERDSRGSGVLVVCPTPIGNLGDMTPRCLKALAEADAVIAEDTRHTRQLLTAFEMSRPMLSLHRYNEARRVPQLLSMLEAGDKLALVSDAGMPGISDPGERLIRATIERGLPVVGLPGPNAALLALVLSGLPTGRFAFEGFLPRRQSARRAALRELKEDRRTLIFFEAPQRVCELLADMSVVFGNRRVAVARELTKLHEEVIRGPVDRVVSLLGDRTLRGEFTVVVEGAGEECDMVADETLCQRGEELMSKGVSQRDAAVALSLEFRVPRRRAYQLLMGAQERREGDD